MLFILRMGPKPVWPNQTDILSPKMESHTVYTLSADTSWPQITKQPVEVLPHLEVQHAEELTLESTTSQHHF